MQQFNPTNAEKKAVGKKECPQERMRRGLKAHSGRFFAEFSLWSGAAERVSVGRNGSRRYRQGRVGAYQNGWFTNGSFYAVPKGTAFYFW